MIGNEDTKYYFTTHNIITFRFIIFTGTQVYWRATIACSRNMLQSAWHLSKEINLVYCVCTCLSVL